MNSICTSTATTVWSFFKTDVNTGCVACIECKKSIKLKIDNVPTEMMLHLNVDHPENYQKIQKYSSCKNTKIDINHSNVNHTDDDRVLNEIESCIIESIARFWQDKTFTDVIIFCGKDSSNPIRAHGLILAALSKFLKDVIESVNACNANTEDVIIILPDVNRDTLTGFLDKIYNGSDEELSVPQELKFLNLHQHLNASSNRLLEDKTIPTSDGSSYHENDQQPGHVSLKKTKKQEYCDISFQPLKRKLIPRSFPEDSAKLCLLEKEENANGKSIVNKISTNAIHEPLKKNIQPIKQKTRKMMSAKKIRKEKENQLVMFSKQKGPRIGTPSIAWNFFEIVNSNAAKCLVCEALVSTTFSSTSGLLKHLKIKHLSYCEQWETENVKHFNNSFLEASEAHPIHQHFKEMDRAAWSCTYCDTVFLGIDLSDLKSLDEHLEEHHNESFRDYELEKVAILCRKGKENRSQLINLVVKKEATEEKQTYKISSPEESNKLLKNGLSNILASDFFVTLGKEMLECTLCSGTVRLKSPLTLSNESLSSNLWKHLKISHFDIYETMQTEKHSILSYIRFHHTDNPIWNYFSNSKSGHVQCLECNEEIEVNHTQRHLLEGHLSSVHRQSYLELKSNEETTNIKIDELVATKHSSGLLLLFESFFETIGDSKYRCKECKTRTSVSELDIPSHVTRHHKELLSTKLRDDPIVKNLDGTIVRVSLGECFCSKCDPITIFASTTALESHDRYIHLGERPYECNYCDRTFIRSDELKLHKRYHEDREAKKGAMCSQCGMVFNSSASRIRHENTVHHNIRRHGCKFCGKKFASSQALERHSRIHSDVKPHQCNECGQQFREVAHLKVHYRTHSGEKPISCPNCSLRFKHYAGRRSHKCEGNL